MFRLFAVELDAKLGVLVVTLHVMFRQSAFGTFIVTVWLVAVNDELSKITSSMEVGGHCPPAPPLVDDHLFTSFQFPLPPTQYRVLDVADPPACIVIPVLLPWSIEFVAVDVVPPIKFRSFRLQ
jgi:hypothetical protein